MNDIAHKQMVQTMLAKRFGSHHRLYCKYTAKHPLQAVREYQRITNAYLRIVNELIKEHLPEIRAAAREEREQERRRYDDASDLIAKVAAVFNTIAAELEKRTHDFGLYDKIQSMARLTHKLSIKEWRKAVQRTLGVDLLEDYYEGEAFSVLLKQWVEDNVGLIKTLPQATLGNMRTAVLDGYMKGRTTGAIVKLIQKQYSIGRRRAQLIARDQIAKLNGQIAKKQQTDAGVEEYIWSTSGDSRVRESHAKLDGKRFRWDDPPIVDEKTGRRCHPMEDYQCRCVPIPVFDRDTIDIPVAGGGEKQ